MEYSSLTGLVEPRISTRFNSLSQSVFKYGSTSIQSISKDRADQIGNYRVLKNPKLTEDIIISEMGSRCAAATIGKTVLCIHDSSEANFYNHSNRLQKESGLGPIDASGKKGIGFKMHNSLVVDAKSFYPYGFSNVKIWARDMDIKSTASNYNKLPTKEKESYKWQECCNASNEVLKNANKIIHIEDREGDLYNQFLDFKKDDKIFHIIRSTHDRTTENGKKTMARLAKAKIKDQYELEISNDSHSKTKKRIATMKLKFIKVKFQRPDYLKKDMPSETDYVTIIETKETNPPKNVEPLHWILITSCTVNSLEDAHQIITWYEQRWNIEEFFRILKKENFDIESSELETGWALRKMSLMAMNSSLLLFQVFFNREMIPEGETLETISALSDDELECLKHLNIKYSGKTEKQKNPFKEKTAQWVVWILARIGGWKSYQSQHKPGATTILRGLQRFYEIYSGWVIAKDVCTR